MNFENIFTDCDTDLPIVTRKAQVCIIGTGPAGLMAAAKLAAKDISVLMIERGSRTSKRPTERQVAFEGEQYEGFTKGLAFGWGGSSSLWGGQLLPLLKFEMDAMGPPWNQPDYQIELTKAYLEIENLFGVSPASYDPLMERNREHPLQRLKWGPIFPLMSKWITFGKRNLGSFFLKRLLKTGKVNVLLNSRVVQWEGDGVASFDTVKRITCCNNFGKHFEVKADYYILAAGALETPLMLQKLLGIEEANKLGVGEGLHDHLSIRIAEMKILDRARYENTFAPTFEGNTMRSPRLWFKTGQTNSDAAYFHFVTEAPEFSGFAVLRDVLRGMQSRDSSLVKRGLKNLPRSAIDIIRLILGRVFKKRLLLSSNTRVFVNIDIIQERKIENKIRLDSACGEQPIIAWHVDKDTFKIFEMGVKLFRNFWIQNSLSGLGKLTDLPHTHNKRLVRSNLYDIYHPAGTCSSCVDGGRAFKLVGKTNVSLLGSSTFQKLGISNPTLSIMAAAIIAAENIVETKNIEKSGTNIADSIKQ